MEGNSEEWAHLSEAERKQRLVVGTFELLKMYVGNGIVTFKDTVTPKLFNDDPNRHCVFSGELLQLDEDENGPWALIKVLHHKIQMTSEESLYPGLDTFIAGMYSQPNDINRALEELLTVRMAHPETEIYLDLPVPHEPTKFYVADMPACVAGPKPK